MKKKVLIFGPIADYGGREVECGFIANALSANFTVEVCSTGSISEKTQVLDLNPGLKIFSVEQLLYKKAPILKVVEFINDVKNRLKGRPWDYKNNVIAKKYFRYNEKVNLVVEEIVQQYDLVFICAQFRSKLLAQCIAAAKKHGINVVFRTTGVIKEKNFDFIAQVNCFLHHSQRNARLLDDVPNQGYRIIDQCALNEKQLLEIPAASQKIKTFLTIARLVEEKNIDVVIGAFQQLKSEGHKLYIIGDGPKKNDLMQMAAHNENVIFTGHVPNEKISEYFETADCVIISHYNFETGPLTGIEAMAAGRIIISAKTGAMQERLPFSNFWFDNTISDLAAQMQDAVALDADQVKQQSAAIRERYLNEYNAAKISSKYLNTVATLIS
ncbi:hypothetical protein FNO01nite_10730 [Flavobacterium noncentrifugens]|uniref:Glycosyltransferase involved in cell wall bisynthesis n=1 Tax=Flavobacterium noncentrifugens TaxID=1128970 RepID=A0A1G8V9E7_9FLAO|nr:glycosyltransferase family 4 protein [Flavobacterium noncentrifugens]GEP50401.1 hypothetical protein FNO01nite_10730 [Flavobacterium noncentrifugens]SDJ62701.1 Glycosyltransferase involved in cell wall bisynthesis [Flavobacterium noncentrifugens]